MKKILLISLSILLTISLFVGCGSDETDNNSDEVTDQSSQEDVNNNNQEENNEGNELQETEVKEEVKELEVNNSSTVEEVGYFNISLNNSKTAPNNGAPQELYCEAPDGKQLIFTEFTIENLSDKTLNIDFTMFNLTDEEGNIMPGHSVAYNESNLIIARLQPGEKHTGEYTFEIPQGSGKYNLEFSAENTYEFDESTFERKLVDATFEKNSIVYEIVID